MFLLSPLIGSQFLYAHNIQRAIIYFFQKVMNQSEHAPTQNYARFSRVLHKPTTTFEQRLAALEAAEATKRATLAKPFVDRMTQRRAANNYAAQSKPTDKNHYYQYFHSSEGDEETKKSVLAALKANCFEHESPGSESQPRTAAPTATWREREAELKRRATLGLRPECASLYVKYEKLHEAMKKEDEEFQLERKKIMGNK